MFGNLKKTMWRSKLTSLDAISISAFRSMNRQDHSNILVHD